MNSDWQSQLAALRSSMGPIEEPEEQPIEKGETAKQTERLDIIVEKKGRAGKCATIITGFTVSEEEIVALAAEMKRKLATGGSVRGGEILIQGNRAQEVLKFLQSRSLKARII